MRIILILIIIFGASDYVFSQDKFEVSFYLTPILSNSHLTCVKDSINSTVSSNDYIENRNKINKPLFGFKSGCNLIYNANQRISFSAGISYLYQEIIQSFLSPIARYEVINGKSLIVMDNYEYFHSKYQYVSLPIGILIKIVNIGKFEFSISSGISVDYLIQSKYLKNKVVLATPNRDQYNYYDVKDFSSELNLGLVCDYNLGNRSKIFLRPNYNYFVTPNLIEDNMIKQHNYYYGIDFGIKYKINGH